MARTHYLIAAALTFSVAILLFSGLVMGAHLVGRLVVGAFWSAATIAWISCYICYHRIERSGKMELVPVRIQDR